MRIAPVLAAALIPATLALVGCAPTPPTPSAAHGVSLSMSQGRQDREAHRLQIAVTNDTGRLLTVTAVAFASPRFDGEAVWPKAPTTIQPGVTASLPVTLPAAVCGPTDGPDRVRLTVRRGDGTEATGILVPADPEQTIGRIHAEDCLAASVTAVAAIRATTPPRIVDRGGRLLALVDLTVTPTGHPGRLRIESVGGTVLLGIVDPDTGRAIETAPVAASVGPGVVSTITLAVVPNRCDPHAVAEDKRGTVFGVTVTTEEGTGLFFVASSDAVRAALYDFVAVACAE